MQETTLDCYRATGVFLLVGLMEAYHAPTSSAPFGLPEDAAMGCGKSPCRPGTIAESAKCSCAVSVLWLPLRAYTFLIRSGGAQASASPLAESALLLLLALLHHAPAPELGPGNPSARRLPTCRHVLHMHEASMSPALNMLAGTVTL